jgi:hypothetical protein
VLLASNYEKTTLQEFSPFSRVALEAQSHVMTSPDLEERSDPIIYQENLTQTLLGCNYQSFFICDLSKA